MFRSSSLEVLPWPEVSAPVDHQTRSGRPAPSLPAHYKRLLATALRSARLLRIDTQPLAVCATWSALFRRRPQYAADRIGARRSHVPHRHLDRARATSNNGTLVLMSSMLFRRPSVVYSRSPSEPHLTHHMRLFRDAHHHDSFTAAAHGGLRPPPARATTEDLPPLPVQHRLKNSSRSTPRPSPSAFVAHRCPSRLRCVRRIALCLCC